MARYVHIWLVLSVALPVIAQVTGGAPSDAVSAAATYVVGSATSIHAIVHVRVTPTTAARPIVVLLPFVSTPGGCRAEGSLVGFSLSERGSVAVALVPSGRSEFDFDCDLQNDLARTDAVRIIQGSDTFILVVPEPAIRLSDALGDLARDVTLVREFSSVTARLPVGFTLPGAESDVVLKTEAEIPLEINKRAGTYELRFRPPTSAWVQSLDSILQGLVVFVFAILIAIASPGFIPATYYFRIVNTFAVLLLVFIVARWFALSRAAKPLYPLVTDSILAACYFGVGYGLPVWRKRSEGRRANASTPPPPPRPPATGAPSSG